MPAARIERAGKEPAAIELRPQIGELARLSGFIEQFAEEHDWQFADVHAFTLAAEELFANTVSHSHPAATAVAFSLGVCGGFAQAMYVDDGAAFDPTGVAEVDTTLPLEQRAIGGLGVHFIRKTMTLFAYERLGAKNVIRFGRALKRSAAGA